MQLEKNYFPLIIFKGKMYGIHPGISYSATLNGWMETQTFANYFHQTFLNHIPKERPVVLVYDGHSSHTLQSFAEKCCNIKVTTTYKPPSATNVYISI